MKVERKWDEGKKGRKTEKMGEGKGGCEAETAMEE